MLGFLILTADDILMKCQLLVRKLHHRPRVASTEECVSINITGLQALSINHLKTQKGDASYLKERTI